MPFSTWSFVQSWHIYHKIWGPHQTAQRNLSATNTKGQWLCAEDKQLYRIQLESNGTIGYATSKDAPLSTIHPSKRIKMLPLMTLSPIPSINVSASEDESSSESFSPEELPLSRRRNQPTKSGANLVSCPALSTKKASSVLENLSQESSDVPTPSQSGIWRRVIKNADAVKLRLKERILLETCLHFDGKKLDSK